MIADAFGCARFRFRSVSLAVGGSRACARPCSPRSSSAFVAPALPATSGAARAPAVCMGAPPPEAVTRRAALAALAAAVVGVGGASSATAGPAASQSFFGYGGASSPYSYADKSTGSVLYKVRVGLRFCARVATSRGHAACGVLGGHCRFATRATPLTACVGSCGFASIGPLTVPHRCCWLVPPRPCRT